MRTFVWLWCWLLTGINALSQQKYLLVEMPEQQDASCTAYRITDAAGKTIPLPGYIQAALECPALVQLEHNVLTFRDADTVKQLHFDNQKVVSLFVVPAGADGVSGPVWAPGKRQLLFLIVNQQKTGGYAETGRLLLLTLGKNKQVTGKRKFDRPVHYVCGSICTATPGTDFMFRNNGKTISYKRSEHLQERPGVYEHITL